MHSAGARAIDSSRSPATSVSVACPPGWSVTLIGAGSDAVLRVGLWVAVDGAGNFSSPATACATEWAEARSAMLDSAGLGVIAGAAGWRVIRSRLQRLRRSP